MTALKPITVVQEKRYIYHSFQKKDPYFSVDNFQFHFEVIKTADLLTNHRWASIDEIVADNGVKTVFLNSINKIFGEQKYYNEDLGNLLVISGKIFQHFILEEGNLKFKDTDVTITVKYLAERIVSFLKVANVFVPSSAALRPTSMMKYSNGVFSYCQQIGLIGQGCYGAVSKGILIDSNGGSRICAVKRPLPNVKTASAALMREIEKTKFVWSKIPGCVAGPILDVFQDESGLAMVVPLADQTLWDLIVTKLSSKYRMMVCVELLKILLEMKKNGILHCDFKLENILVFEKNGELNIRVNDWERMQVVNLIQGAMPPSQGHGFETEYLDANAEGDLKLKSEKMFGMEYIAMAVSCFRALTGGRYPFKEGLGDVTAYRFCIPGTYHHTYLRSYPEEVQHLFEQMLDPDPFYRPPLEAAIEVLEHSIKSMAGKTKKPAAPKSGSVATT